MQHNPFAGLIAENDAAAAAGETRRTWQRRRQLRAGPDYLKIGPKVYYRPDAIERWLASLEVKPRGGRTA